MKKRSMSFQSHLFLSVAVLTLLGSPSADARDLAVWSFDHAEVGDSLLSSPLLDEVNQFRLSVVEQGGKSPLFGEPSTDDGNASLFLPNDSTGNENGCFLSLSGVDLFGDQDHLKISLSINPSELKLGQIIRKTVGGQGLQLYLQDDGRVGFRLEDTSGAAVTIRSEPVVVGEWTEVVAEWSREVSPNFMSISVNGVETLNTSIAALETIDTSESVLAIGALYRSASSNGQFFNGSIDHVVISSGEEEIVNSLEMRLSTIPGGTITMGSNAGDFDEAPTHQVTVSPFAISQTEVTNAQFEEFMPSHADYRTRANGVFSQDDHPVTNVTWYEAVAFCEWLSEKEGVTYRLPTEAEWEFACRAGSTEDFSFGASLPEDYNRGPVLVGTNLGNRWGLKNMHGNVEEWCADWYGPYTATSKVDPVGRATGQNRVTRGGSKGTDDYYLRSANRAGSYPGDRDINIGFRVVLADAPTTAPVPADPTPLVFQNVSQEIPSDISNGPNPYQPFFSGPIPFVKIASNQEPLYTEHNHNPTITVCPNGDLLALWYSNEEDATGTLEAGRSLSVAASRFRYGATEWDDASLFFDGPDRNDHAPIIWTAPDGRLFWVNGLGTLSWGDMSTIMSVSSDNGATWSETTEISSHGGQAGPINKMIEMDNGRVLFPLDWAGNAQVFYSDDLGQTWNKPGRYASAPSFDTGGSGVLIWGIHATMEELANGDLLAFGRISDSPIDVLPRSVSTDGGITWNYSESEFPDISYGQRPVLMRLKEGPLALFSFSDSRPSDNNPERMTLLDFDGNTIQGQGLYCALSWDDGATWPVKKLVTSVPSGSSSVVYDGGAWTNEFVMSSTASEPKGYLSATQSKNGIIHLLSSRLHYQFNLKWLVQNSEYDLEEPRVGSGFMVK